MVTANRDFVRIHPIATKRALLAILKATDICALDPSQPAQLLVKWVICGILTVAGLHAFRRLEGPPAS
jgi:hypothetical protein